jgi:hypothetical protein
VDRVRLGLLMGMALVMACFGDPPAVAGESDTDAGGSTAQEPTSTSPTSGSASTTMSGTDTATSSSTTEPDDSSSSGGGTPGCDEGPCLVDIVVIVDNSGTMAAEQQQIGKAMPDLESGLRKGGYDVHVMFTTTDFGNPLCTPFEPDGYDPAMGAPTLTACTERLGDFTGLGGDPEMVPDACTSSCPAPIAPAKAPFVAFGPDGTNVPMAPDTDVDGDDVFDTPAAQALACLAPQGINGCGFESPLETIVGALSSGAPWNDSADPFLRAGSTVAIVLVTDEADCSIDDFGVMDDPTYQEIDPNSGTPSATSAICWNAGVVCDGGPGIYNDCTSADPTPLHALARYQNFVEMQLSGHEVVMLGVVGVPSVTAHMQDSPWTPIAGGVDELVYQDWRDGEYPVGDILPDAWAAGVTAADQQHLFGIGPGCTGGDAVTGFTGQAIPPVRVRELCESLDAGDAPEDRRCCLESVCDGDYAPAMTCLVGLVNNTFE